MRCWRCAFCGRKPARRFFWRVRRRFLPGIVFYILAILERSPASWTLAIPITLIALGAAAFYSRANQVRAGRITPFGVVYIGEVLFMAACALCGAFQTSDRALFLFFLGGLCFSLSDNMLVALSFGKEDHPYRNAVLHVLYYMAQVFIALSILFQ